MHKNMKRNCTKQTIKSFHLDEVSISDTYSVNALNKELTYLLSLDPDKLIAGFYEMQGKPGKAEKYLGWENTEIKGHTLGHYIAAVAQGYLNTNSEELLERLNYMMDELKQCQLENGYLFASDQALFDRVENRQPAWVPWYTMDKILSGLVIVYKSVGNKVAFEIASKLGDWIYNRTKDWSKEMQALVLSVEYGGMNDALYELYSVTQKDTHLFAAHMFDELPLFTAMNNREDILDGKHANTTIPKILGALNRYITLGETEEFYLTVAENFWDIVVNHHTYVTGGNSEWEHFGAPDILDAERTNCNCETCNTYNMLKLSKGLFQVTGNKKYADFYERAHINAILASQNPETGMSTYFQPMATGYFKVYGTPFDKFWCCTGTGMENFTKLNDGIYFYNEDRLYVNRYISSEVVWSEKGFQINQQTDLPNDDKVTFIVKTFEVTTSITFNLLLRIPDWIVGDVTVKINGESVAFVIEDGFAVIESNWCDSDRIELTLPMKVSYSSLQDNPRTVAFTYGPFVLSATLGKKDMRIIQTGVSVDIPTKDFQIKDFIILKNRTIDEWLKDLENHLVKKEGMLEFSLKGTDEDDSIKFTPLYKQFTERYGVYWELIELDSEELQTHILNEKSRNRLEQSIIDKIPLGNDQYELVHDIKGEHIDAGGIEGHRCRVMREKGWVSYQLAVSPGYEHYIGTTYFKQDLGKAFRIYIDDELLLCDTLKDDSNQRFFDKQYFIPNELIEGKRKITVKFEHEKPDTVNSIWDFLFIRKAFDDNTDLKSLRYDGNEVKTINGKYVIKRSDLSDNICLKFTPNNPNALVYVNEVIINDTLPRSIKLNGEQHINVIVEAEDRIKKQQYCIQLIH